MKAINSKIIITFTLVVLMIAATGLWTIENIQSEYFELPLEYHSTKPGRSEYKKIRTQLSFTNMQQEIIAEFIDSLVIIEGDIIIGKMEDYEIQPLAAIKGEGTLWPSGIIPYEIQSNHPKTDQIKKAIGYLNSKTNIQLIKRNQEVDYLYFVTSGGCSSWVGKQKNKQIINIGNCSFGSTVHEILHSAGFYHEQARSDRDKYIEIVWQNIKKGKEHNFLKYLDRGKDGEDIGQFDYNSIMHYGPKSFAKKKNKRTIIVKKPPGKSSTVIGQREGLSSDDLKNINSVYRKI